MRRLASAVLPLLLIAPAVAGAQDVIRYKIPNSHFPIAAAVEVPAGKSVVYVSGQMATLPKGSAPMDTEAQTVGALKNIQKQLQSMHLGLGDVVAMHAFLVADKNQGGKLDFAGFMKGYTQFFGTREQPNLPARSAMQVAALANPAGLVEIEVTAVRP